MSKVRVFISSTCFDLNQIRKDLEEFLLNIGYEAVMSDSPNIAVPEGLSKIEACKWLVRSSDIFVLVIGGRYGTTDEVTGKPITVIEYETARSARIPIYVFVDNEVWIKRDSFNKLRDMAAVGEIEVAKIKEILGEKIENTKVFELIEQIDTEEGGRWMFPFTIANDIIEKLKVNWSLEFKELLNTRSEKLRHSELRNIYKPVLRLNWVFNGEVLGILKLKKPKVYNQDKLIQHYKDVMVSTKELGKIKEKEKELMIILKNISHKKLGFTKTIDDIDSIISMPTRFNSLIQYNIDKIVSDFEYFLCNMDAIDRIQKPFFQISNEGTVPAEEIIIYIEIPDGISVIDEKDVPEFIQKRSANLEPLLKILTSIDKLYKEAIEIGQKPTLQNLNEFSELLGKAVESKFEIPNIAGNSILGSRASTPLSAFDTLSSSRKNNVFIEDGNIRINIGINKLKHGFTYNQDSDLVFYISSLKAKDKLHMSFKCFADNLPIPDTGELLIEAI